MKELRSYQRKAIDSIYDYWRKSDSGHGVVVIPTAGGKSLVMAALVKELCELYPGTRILILSHVKELIAQNHDELIEYWPDAPVGVFSAGIGRKEIQAQVLIASIQSLDKHVHKLDPAPEIVLVDECHLIARSECTRYKTVLKTLGQMYHSMRCVGFSATPYRLDSGWLHLGSDAIFNAIIYEAQIQPLIDQGFLSPVIPYACDSATIKTDGVLHSGKEFIQGALESAAMSGDITEKAVCDMVSRGEHRKKWLVFACGLKHATQISECLEKYEITNKIITGDTPKKERDEIIDTYKNGGTLEDIRCIINVNVLTTGFNVPQIDLIAMMRPTESCGLYVQMVGRGMRMAKGKENCVVLDYAGNTIRHGPIDMVNPKAAENGEGGIAPVKECPQCYALILAQIKVCPYCGFIFPKVEVQIESSPVEAPILKSQVVQDPPQELDVISTEFRIHRKEGKSPSVRIVYNCGMREVSEWISPEAGNQWGSFFYQKACKNIGLSYPYPETAEEFLDRPLPKAEKIVVQEEGMWTRVKKTFWKKEIYEDIIPF